MCNIYMLACLSVFVSIHSYLRAVAMARHKDFLVEKKRVNKFNLSVKCGSIKDVSVAFAQMMELTMPSKTYTMYTRGREGSGNIGMVSWSTSTWLHANII